MSTIQLVRLHVTGQLMTCHITCRRRLLRKIGDAMDSFSHPHLSSVLSVHSTGSSFMSIQFPAAPKCITVTQSLSVKYFRKLSHQVCVEPRPSAVNMHEASRIILPSAGACSRYRSIAGTRCTKPAARRCCCRSTGQTDRRTDRRTNGRTPDSYIGPAPHTMRSASVIYVDDMTNSVAITGTNCLQSAQCDAVLLPTAFVKKEINSFVSVRLSTRLFPL